MPWKWWWFMPQNKKNAKELEFSPTKNNVSAVNEIEYGSMTVCVGLWERGGGGAAKKERGVERWSRMRFNSHKTGVLERENRGDIWEEDGWVSSRIDEKHNSSE